MKINVEVDLSDFYAEDYETSFSDEIKNYIAHNVKSQIWAHFKTESLSALSDKVKSDLNLAKEFKINEVLDLFFKEQKIKKQYSNDEYVPFADYVVDYLKSATVNSNDFLNKVKVHISSESEKISKELKDRYDLLFASQIVSKLNEQGFLKEDVAKMLLEK